jgi:hypothetical protein
MEDTQHADFQTSLTSPRLTCSKTGEHILCFPVPQDKLELNQIEVQLMHTAIKRSKWKRSCWQSQHVPIAPLRSYVVWSLGVSPAFLFMLRDPRQNLGALLTRFPPSQEPILDMVNINEIRWCFTVL